MKMRFLLSSLALLFFALLGGGSKIAEDGRLTGWGMAGIGIAAILIALLYYLHLTVKEKEEEQALAAQEKAEFDKKMADIDAKIAEKKRKIAKLEFEAKYGVPDKTIKITKIDDTFQVYYEYVHVFIAKSQIYIINKMYNFADIVGCFMSDDPEVIKGKISAITKTNNANMVARSLVGGALAGTAGAIIGGTTARRDTHLHQEKDRVYHTYTIVVNINSLTDPVLTINVGPEENVANEIVGLLNVIISRNKAK